jgi:hypothetical protein
VEIASIVVGLVLAALPVVRRRTGSLRYLPAACATMLLSLVCLVPATTYSSAAEDAKPPAKGRPEGEPLRRQLVKPKNWPAEHPLPLVGSNCAACHLTAGRELTAAVVNFTRSVHDLNEMTCYDCHGGNTRDDVKAHEGEFGFIGTKKSAHITGCSECHVEAAEKLAAGPHHWDFSKRINTQYPLCFDCHGNHDIGNPPADFKLAAMCGDCHQKLDKQFPNIASVVKENDRLWDAMRKVRKKNIAKEDPLPEAFRKDVDGLRFETMEIIHNSKEVSADRAAGLNKRVEVLRNQMEKWLQSTP